MRSERHRHGHRNDQTDRDDPADGEVDGEPQPGPQSRLPVEARAADRIGEVDVEQGAGCHDLEGARAREEGRHADDQQRHHEQGQRRSDGDVRVAEQLNERYGEQHVRQQHHRAEQQVYPAQVGRPPHQRPDHPSRTHPQIFSGRHRFITRVRVWRGYGRATF